MDDYQMIQEGDKIAVGISGGKDSLTLLYAMANLRRFYPKKFSLIAITVDLGYEGFDLTPVKLLCEHLQVEYHIVSTEIAKIIFSNKNHIGFSEGIIFITGFSYIGIYKTAVISCTFCTSTTITSLDFYIISAVISIDS